MTLAQINQRMTELNAKYAKDRALMEARTDLNTLADTFTELSDSINAEGFNKYDLAQAEDAIATLQLGLTHILQALGKSV